MTGGSWCRLLAPLWGVGNRWPVLPQESPFQELDGGVVGYFHHGYDGHKHQPINNLRGVERRLGAYTLSPWEGAISLLSMSSGCGPRSPRRPGSRGSPRPCPPCPLLAPRCRASSWLLHRRHRRREARPPSRSVDSARPRPRCRTSGQAGARPPLPCGRSTRAADCAKLPRDAGTTVMPARR